MAVLSLGSLSSTEAHTSLTKLSGELWIFQLKPAAMSVLCSKFCKDSFHQGSSPLGQV